MGLFDKLKGKKKQQIGATHIQLLLNSTENQMARLLERLHRQREQKRFYLKHHRMSIE